MKSEHLKRKADQALKDGNYRLAWELYSEAIEVKPDKKDLQFLYSNRSLAYQKGGRPKEALADAEAATALAPAWGKAHWRRGTALNAIGDFDKSVEAFYTAWKCGADERECRSMLWKTVQRLTREQLGKKVLALIERLEAEEVIDKPGKERPDDISLAEAVFRMVSEAHKSNRKAPGPYHTWYMDRLMEPEKLTPAEAYSQRSEIYRLSKAYLQARADAETAINYLGEILCKDENNIRISGNNNTLKEPYLELEMRTDLATAFIKLGKACMAEKDHPDKDPFAAFKAFTRAIEFDTGSQEVRDSVQQAAEELTKEGIEAAQAEIFQEGIIPGWLWKNNDGTINAGKNYKKEPLRVFRGKIDLFFPEGKIQALNTSARLKLRKIIADVCQVPLSVVYIDKVRPPNNQNSNLKASVCIEFGEDRDAPAKISLLRRWMSGEQHETDDSCKLDFGSLSIGNLDSKSSTIDLVDITPRSVTGNEREEQSIESKHCKTLAIPERPKWEIEAPYRMYRLVTAAGKEVERVDKHPFCMSRVYYDQSEKPEETWVEINDGSCRWRQTGGEVKVIALKVPADLPPKHLGIDFDPFNLKVYNKKTDEIYLEGQLHRGVIPEECFWTHCGGDGEDGCCMTLKKMNLEVLRKHWMHSESWWSRLFVGHTEIEWDDYEKDYSDLPEEVLMKYRISEASKDAEKQLENAERKSRASIQSADDRRKRRRQARLAILRGD